MPGDTKVQFIGMVSTQGEKIVVVIPKEYHPQIKPLKGKKVWMTIEEAKPPKS